MVCQYADDWKVEKWEKVTYDARREGPSNVRGKKIIGHFFYRFYGNMIFTFFSKKKQTLWNYKSTVLIKNKFRTLLFSSHRCQENTFFVKKNKKQQNVHIFIQKWKINWKSAKKDKKMSFLTISSMFGCHVKKSKYFQHLKHACQEDLKTKQNDFFYYFSGK